MKHTLRKITLLVSLICFSILCFCQVSEGDQLTVLEKEALTSANIENTQIKKKAAHTPKSYFRHHSKLSATYDGYLIELTTSDFPLKRDYYLFEQFGQVYYSRIPDQGYAYYILVDFSSKNAIEKYVENIVKHKAPEAKVVEYKNGKPVKKK